MGDARRSGVEERGSGRRRSDEARSGTPTAADRCGKDASCGGSEGAPGERRGGDGSHGGEGRGPRGKRGGLALSHPSPSPLMMGRAARATRREGVMDDENRASAVIPWLRPAERKVSSSRSAITISLD
ncbi:hypothetical protein GUJ93_ZPchr0007g4519 [Zizania palustris]|uniref:Uncharacterized protein n=1 Tax=Zizania palustris TaxID=103762 RepID=A0A8J5VTF7_ZIZPA|nr:hypothetical protein GUJ93_ZPchr0007g4519 [Zizania palustris]